MRRDFKTLILVIVAVVAFLGIRLFTKKTNEQQVEELIRKSKLGNLNDDIRNRNYIYFKLDSLIQVKDYSGALKIVDTANITRASKWNYMGEISLNQGMVRISINYFNKAIALEGTNFCKAVANRAQAYKELKRFDSAILDYKSISIINYDYYKPLAETYQILGENDSAIKYYQIFLNVYPDSLSIKKKIQNLKNGG
jgi:tetratricopeptide (TPR) repeat protein